MKRTTMPTANIHPMRLSASTAWNDTTKYFNHGQLGWIRKERAHYLMKVMRLEP